MNQLYINYQLDAPIIIYLFTILFLYMFRAINAHLQEDIRRLEFYEWQLFIYN